MDCFQSTNGVINLKSGFSVKVHFISLPQSSTIEIVFKRS